MGGSWTTYHKSFGSTVWLAVLITATISMIVLAVINQVGRGTTQPLPIKKVYGGMHTLISCCLVSRLLCQQGK